MHFAIIFLPALAAAGPTLRVSDSGFGGAPDASQIQISNATFSGNGCPDGSVTTTVSDDKTLVTFGFSQFQTYIGPKVDGTQTTKNCQLHLTLRYPYGFQFSVVRSTYHGYEQLDPGVTGMFISSYFVSQDPMATTQTITYLRGGVSGVLGLYTQGDDVQTASTIYSPCGSNGILNVNNRIALVSTNPAANGILTNDDATVSINQQMQLNWRPCKA
ncbi:secreted protein [Thozetella sp. PMI_491]|nr:secreted protein [Thozetella sp. PMI_491]